MYEPFLMQAFFGYFGGLSTMAHFHNLCVSIALYRYRANLSNIFKILYNFGGLIRAICQVWQLVVPLDVKIFECTVLTHLTAAGIYLNKTALQGFLLWRLKNIEDNKINLWVGTVLLATRITFNFAQFFKLKPEALYDEKEDSYFCSQGVDMAKIPILGFLLTDLVIDVYVTLRFMQILTNANKTELLMWGETKRRGRSKFTAIIYWNFLRLFLAISQNAMFIGYAVSGVYRENQEKMAFYINNTQTLLLIALSYAVTIDSQIVRRIESKKTPSKSLKNTSQQSSRNAQDSLIVNEGKTKEHFVTITGNGATINQEDQTIVNEGETKEPFVNITSNDVVINQGYRGIVNEGETKEPSINITSSDAVINQGDRGIVNEGETKEPSVNITSNGPIINQEDQVDSSNVGESIDTI